METQKTFFRWLTGKSICFLREKAAKTAILSFAFYKIFDCRCVGHRKTKDKRFADIIKNDDAEEIFMCKIHVVLVEPEIPQNTGNIARTCSAVGAALHLVRPLGFEIDDRKLKRAGLDYWNTLEIYFYESLSDFLRQHEGDNLWFFTTKASRLYTEVDGCEAEIYLVFGKETRGLPENLTCAHFDRSVRIPMLSEKRSLNLSNSAAIAVYEVLRQNRFEGMKTDGERLAALRDFCG